MDQEHYFIAMMGVSGAGKNTTINRLTKDFPKLLVQCLSDKTRDFRMDNGRIEKEGVDYYKTTTKKFETGIKQGTYLEYNKYTDKKAPEGFSYYGTRNDEVMKLLENTHVIKELDINGYNMLLEQTLDFPYFGLFLDASDMDIRRRMIIRGTKNNGSILSGVINTKAEIAQQERETYYKLIESYPNHNIHKIDANQSFNGVYKDVTSIIKEYIPAMSL